jgi:hypothetical protein
MTEILFRERHITAEHVQLRLMNDRELLADAMSLAHGLTHKLSLKHGAKGNTSQSYPHHSTANNDKRPDQTARAHIQGQLTQQIDKCQS